MIQMAGNKRLQVAAIAFAMGSCGAPLKSADEVGDIFSGSKDLGAKVLQLCNSMAANPEPPNLQGVSLAPQACTEAGRHAQPLNSQADLYFAAVRADGQKFSSIGASPDAADAKLKLQTRTEIWLNRSLLGIVQTLLPALKKKGDNVLGGGGQTTGTGAQQKFAIRVIGEPAFDAAQFKLHLEFELTARKQDTGSVDVQNRFVVDGMLIDKRYIVATVQTVEPAPVERSLISQAKFVVFVVPHAGDIYLDIITDIEMHSFGVDEIMKDQFLKIVSDGLKQIPKFLEDAERQQGGAL